MEDEGKILRGKSRKSASYRTTKKSGFGLWEKKKYSEKGGGVKYHIPHQTHRHGLKKFKKEKDYLNNNKKNPQRREE